MNIKKDDNVIVISGKDKGMSGKVIKTLPKQDRVIVEGVNMIKKHKKPRNAQDVGGIIDMEAPIHVSNVMILDPKTNTRTRIKKEVKNGKKVRVTVKSGSVLD